MKNKEVVCEISQVLDSPFVVAIQTLEEISVSLEMNARHLIYPGYGNGLLSLSLFYAYYAAFKGEERFEGVSIRYFEKAISSISIDIYEHKISYFRELIEIALFVQFVKKEGLVKLIDTDILNDLDTRINAFFSIKLKEGELNHFGALFAGEYYLTRMNEDEGTVPRLQELVRAFEFFAIKDKKGYSWKWPFSKSNGTYLGMICGSSRIISFLARLYEFGILKNECLQLINNATDFILNNEHQPNPGYFPIKIESSDQSDFLLDADLAIARALQHTFRITGRDDVKMALDRTLELCCGRHNYQDCRVGDASIQYGTMGLALRFESLYREMQQENLKEAANFWYEQSIQQKQFVNETAGFQARYNQMQPFTNIAFYEGIAGIGIGLMCYLNKDLPLPTQLI